MSFGNLDSIGPIAVDYRQPSLRWTSDPTAHGIRSCSISGIIPMDKATSLSEMVNNPASQATIGGVTGVLEWVVFSGTALGQFTGYYLLATFDLNVEHQWSLHGETGHVGFSIGSHYLGSLT